MQIRKPRVFQERMETPEWKILSVYFSAYLPGTLTRGNKKRHASHGGTKSKNSGGGNGASAREPGFTGLPHATARPAETDHPLETGTGKGSVRGDGLVSKGIRENSGALAVAEAWYLKDFMKYSRGSRRRFFARRVFPFELPWNIGLQIEKGEMKNGW